MKNYISFALISLWILTSCEQKHSLEADIEGLGNDSLRVMYSSTTDPFNFLTDTVYSRNDKFHLDNFTDESKFYYIFPNKTMIKKMNGRPYKPFSKAIIVQLNPGDKIKISGNLNDSFIDYQSNGSEFNKQYSLVRRKNIQLLSEIVLIDLKIDSLKFRGGEEELIKKLIIEKNEINKNIWETQFDYIKNNWDKDLSVFYLLQNPVDTIGKYYKHLESKSKNGIYKFMIEQSMNSFEKVRKSRENDSTIKVGKIAPDFILETLDGTDFKLSSLNQTYIVIDFWGSWCNPCIKGFPRMKEYYKKYKNQVKFISIACNDTKEKWKNSVKENKLEWLQLINNSDLDKNISVKYSVKGYPTKIIINKNRKIVGIFQGETNDFYKKLDELLY